jgi:hypothetical protein
MEPSEGLTVVWGANEAGKTTLVDFLVGQLFRWERKTGTRLETVLPGLDRFGDSAAAGGLVEVRVGEELLAYPGSPSLLHRLGLEHASLAGLFCVRSGELELPGVERGEFWPELKKLLSGLPRGVDTLREAVHREARLTPSGEPSDRGSPGPRTRHRELQERIRRLEELESQLDRAARFEAEIARIDARRAAMENARRARIAALAEERTKVQAALAELPEPPGEELREWKELCAERMGELSRRLERARELTDRTVQEAARREERERELAGESAALRTRLEAVREANLDGRAAQLTSAPRAGERQPSAFSHWGYRGLMGLMLVLLAVALILPSRLLTPIALPFLVLFVTLAISVLLWRRRRKSDEEARRTRSERLRTLREDSAAAGLEVEAIEEIPVLVRALEVEAARRESELQAATEAAGEARLRAQGAREEMAAAEERGREIDQRTAALARELGVGEIGDADAREARRDELDRGLRDAERRLSELAGPDSRQWNVQAPGPGADLPAWDPGERAQLEEDAVRVESEYRNLRDAFVQAGLATPEDVLTELRLARAEAGALELDWEAGRLAGELFATMDEALERRLSEALDSSGPLSPGALLHRITGRYGTLLRDEGGALSVVDREGRRFPVEQLSRGTLDQVHLALRAGLARSALTAAGLSEPGFLILDDAFLTADWPRREALVEAVAELAGEGWQIIYLTCDDHLRDLFRKAGARLQAL